MARWLRATRRGIKRTRARLIVDGVDATVLVSFEVEDVSVAKVISSDEFDRVVGLSSGSTLVRLSGRDAAFASVPLLVTDERECELNGGKACQSCGMVARAEQLVCARGAIPCNSATCKSTSGRRRYARLFARVTWSDGSSQDVGYVPSSDDRMDVVSYTNGLSFSGAGRSVIWLPGSWKATVTVGATADCSVDRVLANWTVCGMTMAAAPVSAFLDLPDATGITLSVQQLRLTSPTDDARQAPINVAVETTLLVVAHFTDGTQKVMSTDARVLPGG